MLKTSLAFLAVVYWAAPAPVMSQETQAPSATQAESRAAAANQSGAQPLTQAEVRDLIKKNKKNLEPVYQALDERGADFDLDPKIEKSLRKAGADDDLLQAIWKSGPTSKSSKSSTLTNSAGVALHANYEEAMGYKTLENEPDPEKRLRMVQEFEQRFPKSELLSLVDAQAAKAYREKGDLNKIVEYGEKSLELDPNNLFSLLMVAITLPQPRMLEKNQAQSTQMLTRAEDYATRALKIIDAEPAKPNESEEDLKKRKDAQAADAHTALATVAMERDDTAKAIAEFKTAIALSQNPNAQLYFRLGEVYANSDKNAEALAAFSKASEVGRGTVMQQYADQRIAELRKK